MSSRGEIKRDITKELPEVVARANARNLEDLIEIVLEITLPPIFRNVRVKV